MDARLAWYSVGSSSSNLDSDYSSYSLLHSIYGSQASQLPLSDYDSEASLLGTQSEHRVQPRLSPNISRRLSRPKSSPASVIAARERLRSTPPSRPGSAVPKQQRPGSAARRVVRGRPSSAAVSRPIQRPASAAAMRGGASPSSKRRPQTAMGFRHRGSSSTILLDLEEEEEEEEIAAPIIRDTAPVRLTHVPEYFDFWQGKPLRERDFGVKVQKRKAWQRPKSDYGNRLATRNKNKENDDSTSGGGWGSGRGLETLVEKEDSTTGSHVGSRRGSRSDGGLNDKKKSGDQDDDVSKLSVCGSGLSSRRGSKDFGGKEKGNKVLNRGTSDSRNKGLDRLGSGKGVKSGLDDKDGGNGADDDDYFKNSGGGHDTLLPSGDGRGTSLPTITTNTNANLTTNDNQTSRYGNRMPLANKENAIPFNDIPRERVSVRQLRFTKQLPSLVAPGDNKFEKYDYEPRKALAATSWMDGGAGSGSGNTTRFELPMDLRTLEGMNPLQYLTSHCIISNRRMAHCSKVFTKLDRDKDAKLNIKELTQGLVQVHHNCITSDQATSVVDLVQLTNEMTVDLKLFAAICCLAERMLNLFFLPMARREVIETVDFEALDWKLRTCTIDAPLMMLFTQL